jgi:hypothetical protein
LLCPLTEKKDKILSAYYQIDAGNLLSNVLSSYPIPKISTVLQELKGFTYVTALDLNMGYYTFRLDLTASEMCTIIFPWGKYSYKRLPMGFGGSADIFQAQIMDLMASLEFVQAYMDDLLIITRRTLDEHLQKWRQCSPESQCG